MTQSILFTNQDFSVSRRLGTRSKRSEFEWPNLSEISRVALDTETTGVDIYGSSTIVGFSVFTPDRRSWYFPFGHSQGSNLDPDRCRDWARDNLRDKFIRFAEAKFDIHAMLKFGVDLENMNVKPSDVQHDCALIDSRRQSYSLDNMAFSYLKKNKVKFPVDRLKICERSAEDVDEYARMDVELTWDLGEFFAPTIKKEGLERVQKLEQDLIWSTCYMERSGLLLDLDKLHLYQTIINQRYTKILLQLESMLGFRVLPGKRQSMIQAWVKMKLPVTYTEGGTPSFTVEHLEKYWHPKWTTKPNIAVKLITQALQLSSLSSKYFDKYAEAVDSQGHIRFRLHQLKASSEDEQSGTVTGRYSTSGSKGQDGGLRGFNPQQVYKAEQQLEIEIMRDLLVKSIFVAPEGMSICSTDASQIEYRIFGHYAESKTITEVYQKTPWADFHSVVAEMTGLPRKDAKHANFAKLFGAGVAKFAYMIDKSYNEALPIYRAYDTRFPEVRPLLDYCTRLAENRGFVKTLLGRRRRFGPDVDTKYHAGLNAAVQGTAADINKLTVLDLYNNRKDLGVDLRLTFHDEELVYGRFEDEARCRKFYEFMNQQRMDLRVPILWNVIIDKDWSMQDPSWFMKDGKLAANKFGGKS